MNLKKYGLDSIYKKIVFILFFFLNPQFSSSQPPKRYLEKITKGDSLFKEGKYQQAAKTYTEGFSTLNGKAYPEDRLNAAKSYALSSNLDSAFYHLKYLITINKYDSAKKVILNPIFTTIHNDERWNELICIAEQREEMLNDSLIQVLDSVLQKDQKIRIELNRILEKNIPVYEFQNKMKLVDSMNFLTFESIISKYGWPSIDIIGNKGSLALFLLLQHSTIKNQEKYLSLATEAFENGNLAPSQFALLVDRIEMSNGRKQIYGTQLQKDHNGFFHLYPVWDIENLNQRRLKMGLSTIEEYMRFFK